MRTSYDAFCLSLLMGLGLGCADRSPEGDADNNGDGDGDGLASAYAGQEIGPGPIDTRGSLADAHELPAIVEALVHEACIEETISAIEAHEAASMATDPCVAAILESIAADELRHAQLGWRTLRG